MIPWLIFYTVLPLVCSAALWPMLRMPAVMLTPSVAGDVPNATFDFGGLV